MKLSDYFALLEEEEIPQGNIIKNFKIEILGGDKVDKQVESNQKLSSCNVAEMVNAIRTEIQNFFPSYELDMRASISIEWSYNSKFYKFVLASKDGQKDFDISSAAIGSEDIAAKLSSVKSVKDFLEFVGKQEWRTKNG